MTLADARSIVRAPTAFVSAPGLGRHTSGRYPDWQQGTTGSRGPDLERVGCELALEQLDHLARGQAVADQDSLVRRPVVPGGCNHAFDLCGGHSRDRSGHRLIVCHVVARPKRCVSEPNSFICRLISLSTRVFNARRENECAAELMGLEAQV